MLNIIKSKLNTTYKKKGLNDSSIAIYNRDVIPAVRNWKSSIYAYNKNAINLIPIKSKYVMKLIKAYFNLYHLQLESLLRKNRLRRRFRKISTNRIFISDGEFKHTNDKVNITLYVYNKQKLNYLLRLKKRYLTLFKKAKFARKLKLIKNYLRTSMGQERLSDLSLLSIKVETLKKIIKSSSDINHIINQFAEKKARRVYILFG